MKSNKARFRQKKRLAALKRRRRVTEACRNIGALENGIIYSRTDVFNSSQVQPETLQG